MFGLLIPEWLKKWAAIVGGAILAALAAILYGRRQGEKSEQQRDQAAEAKTLGAAVDARVDAEQRVRELPPSVPGAGSGKPDVPSGAARELHNDWSRD